MTNRHIVNLVVLVCFVLYLAISLVCGYLRRKKSSGQALDSDTDRSLSKGLSFPFAWLIGIGITVVDIAIIYCLWHWLAPADRYGQGYVFSGEWVTENPWIIMIAALPAGFTLRSLLKRRGRLALIMPLLIYAAALGFIVLSDYLALHRNFFNWLG